MAVKHHALHGALATVFSVWGGKKAQKRLVILAIFLILTKSKS